MSDIIKLLPDHIANQIAAGEVVQRPASVVKELMENSIDAGATKINLIVKDGGRTLIQLIDNGSGMSETDARMSFERHATSKISSADDLFRLQTKGFRGEALASIAAIAHVSLKTKLHDAELGTEILIEGSRITSQNAVSTANGTSIAVKNLFYNVPARRNFLGKDTTEYQKILEEFLRIALVHYDLDFSFHHNGDEVYVLPAVKSLRLRIVGIYGPRFNERLVPVSEETDIVKITGFVTKPDTERASNDRCFFFVNNRYFKDRYFNHAVMAAYDGMIPSGKYPPYFLYFEVPTQSIDVNVHPTKTEIKFEESQFIYQILRSSVKQALGQHNIVSTLDFEQETSFNIPMLKKGETVKIPEIKVNPDFNPFHTTPNREDKNTHLSDGQASAIQSQGFAKLKPSKEDWENFYGESKNQHSEADSEDEDSETPQQVTISSSLHEDLSAGQEGKKKPFQVNDKYILTSVKNGFMLIDQYRAHCRILFDEMMAKITDGNVKSQQLLFPEELIIDKTEKVFWQQLFSTLQAVGFDLQLEGDAVKILAVPVELKDKNPQRVLTDLMDEYRHSEQTTLDFQARIVAGVASAMAIKGGTRLNSEEMLYIVDALFASTSPQVSPKGKKIIETITIDELTKRFN
ncbi:MAG: DNA mismatch repair endonuclease MutL [Bacteroidetes bacterium]|nr:DNA mismatch repair endonuclease MutL [Bacteroidota bacterium]